MTTDNESWHDDHIPEPLRGLRRRMIKAQWTVRAAREAVDRDKSDLLDAEDWEKVATRDYQDAVVEWKAQEAKHGT